MLEELLELGERGLPKEEVKARNFRARLLGLMYEDLLEVWFRRQGFRVVKRDARGGTYRGRRAAVDFIVERDGRLYAVEAKSWPAFLEGRLKKLALSNVQRARREFRTPFLEGDFVKEYRLEGRGVDGKILIWWDVDEAEAEGLRSELRLDGLISLKKVLSELRGDDEARRLVEKYRGWAGQLFEALLK